MTDQPDVIPGFAVRQKYGQLRRLFFLRRALVIVLPLAALLAIDLTSRLPWLRPVLLLLPLLGLRNQASIWYRHIRRFGFPPARHLQRMLQLDAMRGYDARSNTIQRGAREHVMWFVLVSLAVAGLFLLAWRATGLGAALYPAVFMLVSGVKATVRRARPPAVLVLGASGLTTSRFLLRVMQTAHPLVAVACLHHDRMAPLLDEVLLFFSYRTSDDTVWQDMVRGLVDVSPAVIVDVRKATLPVEFEIEYSVKHVPLDRLFFVGDPEHPAIPRDRCMAEGDLVEALHTLLWGAPRPAPQPDGEWTAPGERWADKRNGYFTFVPPAGWVPHEYDDPRIKVQFNHPRTPEVHLRFIVRQAAGEGYAPSRGTVGKAQAMGFACKAVESRLLGVPCSEVQMSSPHHGMSVLWLFILGDLHFNIQYWAPAKASFDTHYAKVRRSLDTIEVVRKPASAPSIVREQRLAQRLRYARIVADQVSVEEARRTLQEARLEFALEPGALSQIDALLKEIEQAQRE